MVPEENPTVEIPKVDPIVELTRAIKEGQARTDANFELLGGELQGLANRVTELEAARGRASNRARSIEQATSENDLAHEAQLAQERAAREALAAKVETLDKKTDAQTQILQQLAKVASNPLLKDVAKVLITVFLTWAGLKGLR